MSTTDRLTQEARAAARAVTDLENAARNGDTIDPAAFEAATATARLAQLRADGARDRAQADRDAERAEALNALDTAVRNALDGDLGHAAEAAALDAFTTAVTAAATTYLAHRDAVDRSVHDLIDQARPLDLPEVTPGGADDPEPLTSSPYALVGRRLYTPAGSIGGAAHTTNRYDDGSRLVRAAEHAIRPLTLR